MKAKSNVVEGTFFAVPLEPSGFAVGLVARSNPHGVLLAYFFRRWERVPAIDEVAQLTPSDRSHVWRIGDLNLINGEWAVIGKYPEWQREQWKMVRFYRFEDLADRTWLVEYDEDDPNRVIRETRIDAAPPGIESDGLYGAGAVEAALSRSLAAK
jgi:hypothetical protein